MQSIRPPAQSKPLSFFIPFLDTLLSFLVELPYRVFDRLDSSSLNRSGPAIMSALQRLQANEDDAIWRQNASTIRQLYQEERKTLKQVKAIMENEKGFPVTP